ncbi:MAG: lipid-binding SYLF domain-containing protein [Silvibacterium sp.]|nr:lipid-binding SYLF domain-containing protein [Silvibacterium sp.]MBV8438655.1 lipid-binding SYLF domain-containing protein [Silvibacterium sp.]
MKRLVVVLCMAGLATPAFCASDVDKLDSRIDSARAVLEEIMGTPDKGIPESIAEKAVCIGVVPGMVKGAFILGAEYGQGVVTCRTGHGWSGPVFIRMAGGSFGFQIGGQGTDLILVATNHKGYEDLLESKFKIGADAAAAAGPVGRDAQAATDISMRAELLTWSRSRGLFAGVDLNGVSVSQNKDDTEKVYGGPHSFESILHGNVPPPAAAQSFLESVQKYFHEAREQ